MTDGKKPVPPKAPARPEKVFFKDHDGGSKKPSKESKQ